MCWRCYPSKQEERERNDIGLLILAVILWAILAMLASSVP